MGAYRLCWVDQLNWTREFSIVNYLMGQLNIKELSSFCNLHKRWTTLKQCHVMYILFYRHLFYITCSKICSCNASITWVPSSGPPTILKPNPVSALFRLMLRLVHCSFQPGGTGWLGCKWAGCIEWLGTGAEFSNEVAPVCCKEVGGWFKLFCRECARALWSVGFGVFDLNLKHVNRKANVNWIYHNYHT